MAKDANIYVRVEKDVKTQAEHIFNNLGISVTDAINIFLHKSIIEGGIPFDVREPIPNNETLLAMEEADEISSNPNTKRYANFSEILTEVKGDA